MLPLLLLVTGPRLEESENPPGDGGLSAPYLGLVGFAAFKSLVISAKKIELVMVSFSEVWLL